MNRIIVGEKSSNSQPNTFGTAASATSEVCCSAALKACEKLNDRLKPYKETLTSKAKETSKGEIDEYHIFCNAVKAANQDRVCLRFVSICVTIGANCIYMFLCVYFRVRYASYSSHIIVIENHYFIVNK